MAPRFSLEATVSGLLILATMFFYSNFDPVVAGATGIMVLVYWISVGRNFLGRVPILKQKGPQTLLIAVLAFAGWIAISGVLFNTLSTDTFSIFSLDTFAAQAQTTQLPILSSDITTSFVVYGMVIPVAETLFALSFGLLLMARISRASFSWRPKDPRMWYVIGIVGAIMAVFHFTVRRFSDVGLIVSFVFFAFSAALVFYRGQLAEGMLLHIFNNSAVLAFGEF